MQSPEKPTRLGTVSLFLAIIIAVLWCVYFILFAALTEGGVTFGTDSETAGYTLVLGSGSVMAILTVLLSLVGAILGGYRASQRRPQTRACHCRACT